MCEKQGVSIFFSEKTLSLQHCNLMESCDKTHNTEYLPTLVKHFIECIYEIISSQIQHNVKYTLRKCKPYSVYCGVAMLTLPFAGK